MSSLIAVLFLAVSLALIGCDGDDDDEDIDEAIADAQAIENQTLVFDAKAIDLRLAGLTAVLSFGDSNLNTLPFTLELGGNSIEGTATVDSIDFLPTRITNVDGAAVTTISINGVTFGVNILFTIDIVIDIVNGVVVVTITAPDGTTQVISFTEIEGLTPNEQAILLANRTLFQFDLNVIDRGLAGELATVEFGVRDGNNLDFTLDVPADADHPAVIGSGQAILASGSISFVVTSIQVGGVVAEQITINGVTISLGAITLDIDFDVFGADDFTVTFINPDTGDFISYRFRPGETGVTGVTGTGGDDDQG